MATLSTWWSDARGDNFATATAQGIADAQAANYVKVRDEAEVLDDDGPGRVPLTLYWNQARGDNLTSSSPEAANDASVAGYVRVRREGYAYKQPHTDGNVQTVPLKLFWHSGRHDNFLTAAADGEQSAVNAGYRFIRIEGHVLPLGSAQPPAQAEPPAEAEPGAGLGTITGQQQVGKFRHIKVLLHGIYISDDFETSLPFGINETGEFYAASIGTDGRDVVGISSEDMGTRDGKWHGVDGGTWLDTGDCLLWPNQDVHNAVADQRPDPLGNVLIDLRVLESDDSSVAERILDQVGKAGKAWLQQQGGGPAAEISADAAIAIAKEVFKELGKDNVVISKRFGFDVGSYNYRLGRFIWITGQKGTYAIISVRPLGANDDAIHLTASRHLRKGEVRTFKIDLKTPANTPRLVAFYVRPRFAFGPSIKLKVANEEIDSTNRPTFVPWGIGINHVTVKGGNDPIEVTADAFIAGADLEIMATAVSTDGAVAHAGFESL